MLVQSKGNYAEALQNYYEVMRRRFIESNDDHNECQFNRKEIM